MHVIKSLKEGTGIRTLEVGERPRLLVMLRGNDKCVEEHQQEHKPVEKFGLNPHPTLPPEEPVPVTGMLSKEDKNLVMQSTECVYGGERGLTCNT